MNIRDIFEVPLPPDWDKDIYNERVPFAQRIRYAKERAAQLGAGSSRVAFGIPYKGRETILKIAKNRKGAAQNELEAEILGDGYHGQRGVVIPVIDHDEQNSMPTWIHMERAEKVRSVKHLETLISKFNHDPTSGPVSMDAIEYVIKRNKGDRHFFTPSEREIEAASNNEFVDRLMELVLDYDLAIGDIARPANWGVYKGRPVLIDLGASNQIITTYYM